MANVRLNLYFQEKEPNLELGYHNTINHPTVYAWSKTCTLRIRNYVSIAHGARFLCGGEHPKSSLSTNTRLHNIGVHANNKGDIVVGNDVWIGCDATIVSGVTIGDGAIVAAGTVIAKSVGPYEVVAGNPPRVIRRRFEQPVIDALLDMQWWDYEPEQVNAILKTCRSVDEFVARFPSEVTGERRAAPPQT